MQEKKDRRGGLLWPLLLIGLGIILLGNNLGWVDWSIWRTLGRIWPAFLIAAGLDLLIPRRSAWGTLAVLALLVVVIGGALFLAWQPETLGSKQAVGEELVKPLQGATRAEVVLGRAAGRLEVGALRSATNLVEGTLALREDEEAVVDYEVTGGTARLEARNEGQANASLRSSVRTPWEIRLNDAIPMTLEVSVAAGESDLDLRELDLETLRISLAVGANKVTLPAEGVYTAEISGAVGDIEVVVPEGLEARIDFGTALVRRNVRGEWQRAENIYTTPGYAGAESRVDLKIGLALGNVTVRRE